MKCKYEFNLHKKLILRTKYDIIKYNFFDINDSNLDSEAEKENKMENITQVGLALRITEKHLKLGEASCLAYASVRLLKEFGTFQIGKIGHFLGNVGNLKKCNSQQYLNKLLDEISVEKNPIMAGTDTNFLEPYFGKNYSDEYIDLNVYRYFYLHLWPRISDVIGQQIESGNNEIYFKLRITEKTYSGFYSQLKTKEEKAKKLREDLFYWIVYNKLSDISNKNSIEINIRNEIIFSIGMYFNVV